ncbi:MAG: DUF4116 domain-containing protein [Candidatus Margulisbacteria bacterium]|jgi:hypothetical protein|nr:DUF4116 domain-containing protein [Candidatus Margulisiibacteriota bacterium]
MQTKIISIVNELKNKAVSYDDVEPAFWENGEFVRELCKAKGNMLMLGYAADNVKKDEEIMLGLIELDWKAAIFADDSLKKDSTFMLKAFKKAPAGTVWLVFECADDSLKNDPDFQREAQSIIDGRDAA